jgi:hypothetical protein
VQLTNKAVDGGLHQLPGLPEVGHVGAVGHGLATRRADLLHHFLGRPRGATLAVKLHAQVVDHHLGTLAGELEGVGPSDAAARAGNDDDPALADSGHALVLLAASGPG